MTPAISAFPIELVWHILFYIDDRDDILSLALVQRRFYEIIVPHFLDYHILKCSIDRADVWAHVIAEPATHKAVKIVFLIDKRSDDLQKEYIPRACKVRVSRSYKYDMCNIALSRLPNLQSFTWFDNSGSEARYTLGTLTDLNPPLKTLVLHHSSKYHHLPLNVLKPSNLSQLTHLDIRSDNVTPNDVSLMHILLHTEKLTKLFLNVSFDITDVLKTYTWQNLEQLFLGTRVQFFSTEEDDDEDGDEDGLIILSSFFKRHPSLEWLTLPISTALDDCFPSEDIFPNLRALEWDEAIPISASRALTLPTSVAQRLVHYASMFGGGWLAGFRDMSHLQSCCVRLNMDQVRYLEQLFQCAPRISKLRVELVGKGIRLFGWIKRTIDIILDMDLPLTHLLSLFNDVDMGYQMGKETVERVGQIPTLEYTTGCVHGKAVFLKINRKYDTYTGFDVLHDPEAVNDPYLTNWRKF